MSNLFRVKQRKPHWAMMPTGSLNACIELSSNVSESIAINNINDNIKHKFNIIIKSILQLLFILYYRWSYI